MTDSLEWHEHDMRTPWQRYYSRVLYTRAKMWAQGLSTKQIANKCGTTVRTMQQYISDHRWAFPYRDASSNTREDRDRARAMRAEGMTYLAIANELDRPVSTVRSWIAKESK